MAVDFSYLLIMIMICIIYFVVCRWWWVGNVHHAVRHPTLCYMRPPSDSALKRAIATWLVLIQRINGERAARSQQQREPPCPSRYTTVMGRSNCSFCCFFFFHGSLSSRLRDIPHQLATLNH